MPDLTITPTRVAVLRAVAAGQVTRQRGWGNGEKTTDTWKTGEGDRNVTRTCNELAGVEPPADPPGSSPRPVAVPTAALGGHPGRREGACRPGRCGGTPMITSVGARSRTPHRFIQAMCPRHLAYDRWPVHGDYFALARSCVDCATIGILLQDEYGLWLRVMPDLSDALFDHHTATHEAAHAIVGAATGHTVLDMSIAPDGRTTEGEHNPAGIVNWSWPDDLPPEHHLAAIWAGQEASLRWLRENGVDTNANRVDARYGSSGDARRADEYALAHNVNPSLGRSLAHALVNQHWHEIEQLAELLFVRRAIHGPQAHEVVTSIITAKETNHG